MKVLHRVPCRVLHEHTSDSGSCAWGSGCARCVGKHQQHMNTHVPVKSNAGFVPVADDSTVSMSIARSGGAFLRPLVRLPAVLFPGQPVSLAKLGAAAAASELRVSEALLSCAWRHHEGRIAAFGPGSRVGVELHVMFDDVLDALEPTPPGVAHAFGGRRVRLNRTVRSDWSASSSETPASEIDVAELSPFEDEELAPRRQERLLDEAGAARRLLELGQDRGLFALESSALDEELGGRGVCDPRCHPLWPLEASPPEADDELSLWLGARLPLTTELRIQLLSMVCPLRRMQDVVDVLRLLCDPQRPRGTEFKYKLIMTHPAIDVYCRTISTGETAGPRAVVAMRPPSWQNWTSSDSFPHG